MTRRVYFIRPEGQTGPIKIGHSFEPAERLRVYLTWSPVPLEIVAEIEGGYTLERRFHTRFKEQRLHHEWFRASPELAKCISDIRAGAFDVRTLPPPLNSIGGGMTEAGREARQYAMRLTWLERRGIAIPKEVRVARSNRYCDPIHRDQCRAVIRTFVDSQHHALSVAA